MPPTAIPALYGHPFSSYTWKVLIALYANATPFEFRQIDADHPDHAETVQRQTPLGKFPLLHDSGGWLFEATAILEHLDQHHGGDHRLIPAAPDGAVAERMIDRVFDNYVMAPMQAIVGARLELAGAPDAAAEQGSRAMLSRAYAWIDAWLAGQPPRDGIALIECAAAPALFYADWVWPIPIEHARLRRWRAHLLALPAVARCVDEARPYRPLFPLGAPDRD